MLMRSGTEGKKDITERCLGVTNLAPPNFVARTFNRMVCAEMPGLKMPGKTGHFPGIMRTASTGRKRHLAEEDLNRAKPLLNGHHGLDEPCSSAAADTRSMISEILIVQGMSAGSIRNWSIVSQIQTVIVFSSPLGCVSGSR